MTSITSFKRLCAAAMLAGAAVFCLPASASAQFFVNPFVGYNYGGDAGCPEITSCEAKHLNWGVAAGLLGSVVGIEAEFSDTNNFYGETDVSRTRVTTIMGNFLFAPKIGPIQLYGLGGLGVLKSKVEGIAGGVVDEDQDDFGYNFGGGLMVFFGEHVGARFDARYFNAFNALELIGLDHLREDNNKLNFSRFSGGVVFKF